LKKQHVFIGLIAVTGVVAGALILHRQPTETSGPVKVTPPVAAVPPAAAPAETPPDVVPEAAAVPAAPVKEVVMKKSAKQKSGKAPKAPIQDPDARVALSLVGADPAAEAYWESAINDPNLPAEERKDLIEDLNEDGLSDPKHPGPQDMPLIASRLQLIEELAPDAMDQVNGDAFAEAYKDLISMANGEEQK